jgi:hypothetical protein
VCRGKEVPKELVRHADNKKCPCPTPRKCHPARMGNAKHMAKKVLENRVVASVGHKEDSAKEEVRYGKFEDDLSVSLKQAAQELISTNFYKLNNLNAEEIVKEVRRSNIFFPIFLREYNLLVPTNGNYSHNIKILALIRSGILDVKMPEDSHEYMATDFFINQKKGWYITSASLNFKNSIVIDETYRPSKKEQFILDLLRS